MPATAIEIPAKVFYISNRAYGALTGMAQRTGYVKWGTSRAKGMSEFLNDLAQVELLDTRPDIVRQRHIEEVRSNRAPTWLYTRVRRARLLKLTDHAVQCYFKVAFEVGIVQSEPFVIGGPSRTSPLPAVAYVLEAVGLNWLTPVQLPRSTK